MSRHTWRWNKFNLNELRWLWNFNIPSKCQSYNSDCSTKYPFPLYFNQKVYPIMQKALYKCFIGIDISHWKTLFLYFCKETYIFYSQFALQFVLCLLWFTISAEPHDLLRDLRVKFSILSLFLHMFCSFFFFPTTFTHPRAIFCLIFFFLQHLL